MPQRFIVRFRGTAPAREIVSRLRNSPKVEIVDETPRMVLVQARESDLLELVPESPDVLIVREQHYERPDSRPAVDRDPPKR